MRFIALILIPGLVLEVAPCACSEVQYGQVFADDSRAIPEQALSEALSAARFAHPFQKTILGGLLSLTGRWRAFRRKQAFLRFLQQHTIPFQRNADSTEYVTLPDGEMAILFQELEKHFGLLAGKVLLDFGAGALPKIGLAASALYGMHVTAVEKDRALSLEAGQIVADARKEGFAKHFTFLGRTDGFSIAWKNMEIVCFFYTEPSDPEDAARFRATLVSKMQETRPGALLAIIFTEWHLFNPADLAQGIHRDQFPGLRALKQNPIALNPFAMPSLYLQLYSKEATATPSEGLLQQSA